MCFQRCFVALAFLAATAASSRADIFRWDNGELIPGTKGITAGPGVQLDHYELAYAELSQLDLTGSRFDFSNLSNAHLGQSNLTSVNLTGANLAHAFLSSATLTGTNLTLADTRGALGLDVTGATLRNTILPDGTLPISEWFADDRLVVRNFHGAPENDVDPELVGITLPLTGNLFLAVLNPEFNDERWRSTIAFEHGISFTLGGSLELTFATGVDPAKQVGRTFDVFDWTGVIFAGQFQVKSPYTWDLTDLYAGGTVRLTAVPEPSTLVLLIFAAASWCLRRGRAT